MSPLNVLNITPQCSICTMFVIFTDELFLGWQYGVLLQGYGNVLPIPTSGSLQRAVIEFLEEYLCQLLTRASLDVYYITHTLKEDYNI
jgi:hypothetical protein